MIDIHATIVGTYMALGEHNICEIHLQKDTSQEAVDFVSTFFPDAMWAVYNKDTGEVYKTQGIKMEPKNPPEDGNDLVDT